MENKDLESSNLSEFGFLHLFWLLAFYSADNIARFSDTDMVSIICLYIYNYTHGPEYGHSFRLDRKTYLLQRNYPPFCSFLMPNSPAPS